MHKWTNIPLHIHIGYNLTHRNKNAMLLLKLGKYDNLLGVLEFVHMESQI